MEGPSLKLAAEQLKPFIGQVIQKVEGNSKIGIERFKGKKVKDIFAWGKHLVLQFEDFALRVHFMLFGSFQASVLGKMVTGDYPKKNRVPRLKLTFKKGGIEMFSCSLAFLESGVARDLYDFSIDTMAEEWDEKKAFKQVRQHPEEEIGNILLDQNIFAGVGNIIRNEVLFLVKVHPEMQVGDMKDGLLKKVIKTVRDYVFQFYAWRKAFVLRKHYQVYKQSSCPQCQHKITRKKTGERQRISYFCPSCQLNSLSKSAAYVRK